MNYLHILLAVIIVLFVLFGFFYIEQSFDKLTIKNHVQKDGRVVVSIDHKLPFESTPFWGVNSRVYKFIYKDKSGQEKIGWVKLNGILTKWKMDE